MKNLFKYLSIIGLLVFAACDPMEEVYEELDQFDPPTAAQVVEYAISEDDYDDLDDEFGVGGFGNFDNDDQAREFIPFVLDNRFGHLGNGSSVTAMYEIYSPIRINNDPEFTLTEDDYDALGERFPNLNSEGDIFRAVALKYPNPEEEDVVTLNYDYFDGSVSSRTSKIAYFESTWYLSYEPTDDDYDFMGQSRFKNFDSRSLARTRIAVLFDNLFPFDQEGDRRASVFRYYNGSETVDFLAMFEFNGENWVPFQDVLARSLQFGKEDGVWVPDNTIRFTYSSSDYSTVVASDVGAASDRSNLDNFGNFNLFSWDADELLDAHNLVLKDNYPSAEVGQKFLVTYSGYNGSTGNFEDAVILDASGDYVYQ